MKKVFAKISLVALIAAMGLISACGAAETSSSSSSSVSACEHSGGNATCTTAAVCEKCGESYGEALGHSYESVVTDPTCTEDGYTTYTCACGDSYTDDVVPAEGHDYESVVTDPTCTEDGYTTYTCACGDTYTADEVTAKGHSYESVVTDPTCTEDGYTTYTCACGDTYTADEVVAKGHSYETVVTDPTCTEDGYTTYTCACGDTYTADEVAAKGHSFIDSKCVTCEADYVAPATGDWALVTELTNGAQVLIGAPAYGKLLSAEKVSASSYYNKGVDYSVENFGNVTDAEIFSVTVNADGSYTFTSLTGKVIALAESYSSLNDTGVNKSWVLEDKGNGLFLMKNTGRNTYLEWYSSKNNWSTYTAGNTDEYELSFYAKAESSEDHIHNYISEVFANTCTEAGYTSYTCKCGDTYKVDGEAAKGHNYEPVVTDPTCTANGYTTYTCADCNDSYTADEVASTGHNYVEGICDKCGEEDPSLHKHSYESTVTAPTCTVKGYTTHTCACGDSYTDSETEVVPHVDTNLDITCDFEGCTKRILPAADSKVSLFTANHMIIVSLSNNYYVEGVITEITDAKNGVFIIADEEGYSLLVRLPKNADGTSYSAWTDVKVVVGDTVQVYGKPAKNSSSPTTEKAKIESGVVTILSHTHAFSEATCTEAAKCPCLAVGDAALGHINENEDIYCDRCEWNLNWKISNIAIATDPALANGVQTMGSDGKAAAWTWSDDNFNAIIAKGTSTVTLYTTAKAYMQLKKQNTFTLENKNDVAIKTVTLSVTTASYLTNLETVIKNAGFTYTKDDAALTITIEWNSTEDFTFSNTGSSTIYISGAKVIYE